MYSEGEVSYGDVLKYQTPSLEPTVVSSPWGSEPCRVSPNPVLRVLRCKLQAPHPSTLHLFPVLLRILKAMNVKFGSGAPHDFSFFLFGASILFTLLKDCGDFSSSERQLQKEFTISQYGALSCALRSGDLSNTWVVHKTWVFCAVLFTRVPCYCGDRAGHPKLGNYPHACSILRKVKCSMRLPSTPSINPP